MTLTDAHCHLQDVAFASDLSEVIDRASRFGIKRFVVNGTCPKDWEAVSKLAFRFPQVIPQFGVHPWKVEELPGDWLERLKGYLIKHAAAGVGEIGLDGLLTDARMSLQKEIVAAQFQLSREWNRPCTVHAVKSWPELEEQMKQPLPKRWLFHSFGGSAEQVKVFAEKGASFSFGGAVLRQPASEKLKAAIQSVPQDRLLLETDAPFQHPEGKTHRQEPAVLLKIAEKVAEIRGEKIPELLRQCEENAESFFIVPRSRGFSRGIYAKG